MKDVNISEIIAELKEQVKSQSAVLWKDRKIPVYKPKQDSKTKAGEIVHSAELRHLNVNVDFMNYPVTTHRSGIAGKLILKAKNFIKDKVIQCLKPYFEKEREFTSNLVRHLNASSKYMDERDGDIFWELIKKIDYEHVKLLERVEQINEELLGTIYQSEPSSSQTQIQQLNNRINELEEKLKVNQTVVLGLEAILARYSSPEIEIKTRDQSYLLLENRYRGSEELIADRLKIYTEIFKGVENPVLEIGAGRGELQLLFRENSIPSLGVDLDQAMVDVCSEKKLPVVYGDGIEYLSQQADKSLGGLIAIQVVEHLTQAQTRAILELALKKVVSGGRIIFETINPKSIVALSSNYFRDPTHVFPQHPDTLAYLVSLAGLEVEEVRYLSPFPEEAKLMNVKDNGMINPGVKDVLSEINHNFRQLNNLLYADQDFCIIAKVK